MWVWHRLTSYTSCCLTFTAFYVTFQCLGSAFWQFNKNLAVDVNLIIALWSSAFLRKRRDTPFSQSQQRCYSSLGHIFLLSKDLNFQHWCYCCLLSAFVLAPPFSFLGKSTLSRHVLDTPFSLSSGVIHSSAGFLVCCAVRSFEALFSWPMMEKEWSAEGEVLIAYGMKDTRREQVHVCSR